jgi:hypothetical protein
MDGWSLNLGGDADRIVSDGHAAQRFNGWQA